MVPGNGNLANSNIIWIVNDKLLSYRVNFLKGTVIPTYNVDFLKANFKEIYNWRSTIVNQNPQLRHWEDMHISGDQRHHIATNGSL